MIGCNSGELRFESIKRICAVVCLNIGLWTSLLQRNIVWEILKEKIATEI